MMVDLEREEHAFPVWEKDIRITSYSRHCFLDEGCLYSGFISSGFDLSKFPVNGPQKPIQGFPVQCMLL